MAIKLRYLRDLAARGVRANVRIAPLWMTSDFLLLEGQPSS